MERIENAEKLREILTSHIKACGIFDSTTPNKSKGFDVKGMTVQDICNKIPIYNVDVVREWHRTLKAYIQMDGAIFPIRGGTTKGANDRRGMMTRVYASESDKRKGTHDYDFFYCDNDTAVYYALLAIGEYYFSAETLREAYRIGSFPCRFCSGCKDEENMALRQIFWVILSSGGELFEECRT